MKRKKLSLHRETLRNLRTDRLSLVGGGTGNTYEILTGCACTDSCYCGTGGCGGGGGRPNPQTEIFTDCLYPCDGGHTTC